MLTDLPTDQIHPRDDARMVNMANVEALASSIAEIGLINPIRVRPDSDGWEVVAGRHRLEAHKQLGLVEISCIVIEEYAEEAMIDENIIRQELSAVDRARYLARRKELYLLAHPETAQGKANAREIQNLEVSDRTPSFSEAVSNATGRSHSAVSADVLRGERVIEEVLRMVRGTSLDSGTYLDSLARLSPNDQVRAAERDLAAERDKARQVSAETQAAQLAAKAKQRAVGRAAELIVTYVPKGKLDALVAALMEAGKASDVAKEIETLR